LPDLGLERFELAEPLRRIDELVMDLPLFGIRLGLQRWHRRLA